MARSRNEVIAKTLGEMAFDGRDGCGCQGCFAMIFFSLVAITWIGAHRHQIVKTAVVVVGVASAAVLAREGLRRMHFARKGALADGPVPLAQVAPGFVHTAGLIGIAAAPLSAPLASAPCVFFRVTVTDDGLPLFEARSADELVLEDGADAKLTVKLDAAKWQLDRTYEVDSFPNAPHPALDAYLRERGLSPRGVTHACVEWIAPHELVFVRGRVTQIGEDAEGYRTRDRATLVMTAETIALHEAPKDA